MACIGMIRFIRTVKLMRCNLSTAINLPNESNEQLKPYKTRKLKTENSFIHLEDPDTFGTLSGMKIQNEKLKDQDDIKEEQFIQNKPLPRQKLTIKQYADLIKQYVTYKRLKEAIDVLEVKMLQEDRVKPENYIYNILIGACADLGFTKKAFQLFNDMKRRSLKPTGDTYTCLFHACSNSPWPSDGLKNAKRLRELMTEKGIEPNLTNYNSMIKAFGRCGDLTTAFKIVDEMISKNIKIRVHTFNHLLQACISDKQNGLRHALIVWRKMLKVREKPNIYSFNLMLKCVKECNFGTEQDIKEFIEAIQQLSFNANTDRSKDLENNSYMLQNNVRMLTSGENESKADCELESQRVGSSQENENLNTTNSELITTDNRVSIQFLDNLQIRREQRDIPNLLSNHPNLQHVLALQGVQTTQDKFAIIGGQEDFIKEMEVYSVKPDIKTFTQLLPLLDDTTEAENKLLETMKSKKVRTDIDFYNMLIKKRCLRMDYEAALEVKKLINDESKIRKRLYPMNKKKRLHVNIMTYGVLALTCRTKENAEQLLAEMKEEQLKVNIEILGALLRQGTANTDFDYILYILKIAREENLKISDIFLKHLENFNDKCTDIIQQKEKNSNKSWSPFKNSYVKFSKVYTSWLKDVNLEGALQPENPWQQFKVTHPETVQREQVKIEMPKKFYKRNRKFVAYVPKT